MSAAPELIFLMGPTASGKTDLAIALAQELDCELVSVDSALVYRGLDIGSAKPAYPHHLVDLRDPAEPYSVADFCVDAARSIDDIVRRGRTPLLVGGSMMYFRALLDGLAEMPAADPEQRRAIEAEALRHGWPSVHQRLASVDPELAAAIHPHHSQRIGRALEVYASSGVTMTEWRRRQKRGVGSGLQERFSLRQLAICPAQRAVLHERIERRFKQMLSAGFREEVRGLYERGDLNLDLPALRAVGYRQMWGHVAGEYDLNRAVELCIIATRQLARRQLTWLRRWQELDWIYTNEQGYASNVVENPEKMTETAFDVALKCLRSAPK